MNEIHHQWKKLVQVILLYIVVASTLPVSKGLILDYDKKRIIRLTFSDLLKNTG